MLSRAISRSTSLLARTAITRTVPAFTSTLNKLSAVNATPVTSSIVSKRWFAAPSGDEYEYADFQRATVREQAPDFTSAAVINGEIKSLTLSSYKGKWIVLFFYPKDFTFVCPTEIVGFSERAAEFRAVGAEVIGCSVDSENVHLAWINTPRKDGGLGKMDIPLVSDMTHEISARYGVLVPEKGFSLRGLFLIDPNFVLRHVTINDFPVGRNVDEVLRVVQAFQYTEKHGEVCPAGWNPSKPAMKATPAGLKDYAKKVNL